MQNTIGARRAKSDNLAKYQDHYDSLQKKITVANYNMCHALTTNKQANWSALGPQRRDYRQILSLDESIIDRSKDGIHSPL